MNHTPHWIAPLALSMILLVPGCLGPVSGNEDAETQDSPYSEQLDNEVRGLSEEEITDLKAGNGMGLARPAELNGYPGPSHVLELDEELNLTDEQRAEIQTTFDAMQDEAQKVGQALLANYTELDEAFQNRTITETELETRVATIEDLWRKLRLVHLETHLDTPDVLTDEQTQRYHELRGYGQMDSGDHDEHASHETH